MEWKFWQRNNQGNGTKSKLPKPIEIPQQIGMNLITQQKMDPDFVWNLKCALKPNSQSQKSFDFRVFDRNAAETAGVTVANYDSLDAHPELIMFHGRFEKGSHQIKINKGG